MCNEIHIKGRGRDPKIVHLIMEDMPHPQSWASRIMLFNHLRNLDDSMFEIRKYLRFREEFLNDEMRKSGGKLVCVYCNRSDLVIGYTNLWEIHKNLKMKNLATVDHIIPREQGTNPYDASKCCVSCRDCNGKKKNTDPKLIAPPKYGNMNIDTYKLKYFKQ